MNRDFMRIITGILEKRFRTDKWRPIDQCGMMSI